MGKRKDEEVVSVGVVMMMVAQRVKSVKCCCGSDGVKASCD